MDATHVSAARMRRGSRLKGGLEAEPGFDPQGGNKKTKTFKHRNIMKALSIIIDIILCLGLFLVFNDNAEAIHWNLVGIACGAALIYKHRNDPQQA